MKPLYSCLRSNIEKNERNGYLLHDEDIPVQTACQPESGLCFIDRKLPFKKRKRIIRATNSLPNRLRARVSCRQVPCACHVPEIVATVLKLWKEFFCCGFGSLNTAARAYITRLCAIKPKSINIYPYFAVAARTPRQETATVMRNRKYVADPVRKTTRPDCLL